MPRMIVVEAPDVIAMVDLVERLAAYAPQSVPTDGDGYDVRVPPVPPGTVKHVLARIAEWADFWGVRETLIRVGKRHYRLRRRGAAGEWLRV